MGLAYGACSDASASNAARIGVVIAPDGTIKAFESKADVKTYPTSVYELL
jgi:thioredoxin-dependent peroxiredoxin